ncbi:MAG: hypothetical protein Q9M37_10335 [Desulfonauticus sp.]|nr:hypothetical protein [Desulfonauticus sp.]
MNNTYKLAALAFLTLMALNGCESKTENNTKVESTSSENNKLEITKTTNTTTNIEEKKETFKTVAFYDKNKDIRTSRIKECAKRENMTILKETECDNAKRSRQLEKRKNSKAFINQSFL